MFRLTMRAMVVAVMMTVAGATYVFANHSWGGYHWARTANPFTLKVGDNVSSAWDTYVTTTVSDWSASSVMNLDEVAGLAKSKNCRPTSGRIEVCNGAYGYNGWLGIAQIWASGTHITQATTRLNDTYFASSSYNTPAWRQYVVCQEVGHTLGLDHVDEDFNNANSGTCMDYGDPTGDFSEQHPNAHDYQELEDIYAHLDGTSTVGAVRLPSAMPPAMGEIDFDSPGQWGHLVSSSANGRAQTFEQDFGGGHKVITHVLWADPGKDRGR